MIRKMRFMFLFLLLLAGPTVYGGEVTFTIIADASPATVSITNQTIKLGQTFSIDINIVPAGNSVSGWQLQVSWDPAVIKVNGITEGNFLKSSGLPTLFNTGLISNGTTGWNYAAIIGNNSGVSNPGVLMTLNITATGITHNTTVLPVGIKIADPTGAYVPYTLLGNKVVIPPKYDINMDGVTDILDLTILGQNFMQSNTAYDVNGDGIIDITDIVLVAAHFGQTW